jgi:hypothetical protein
MFLYLWAVGNQKEGDLGRKKYAKKALARMTEVELDLLHERSKRAGLSLSRYLVEAGLAPDKVLAPAERERQEKAIYHVRKVGTNLNQIAKVLNKNGHVSTSKLEQALEEQAVALRALIEVWWGNKE